MSLSYIWRDRPQQNRKSPSTVLKAHNSTRDRSFMCNNVVHFGKKGPSLNDQTARMRLWSNFVRSCEYRFCVVAQVNTPVFLLSNVKEKEIARIVN